MQFIRNQSANHSTDAQSLADLMRHKRQGVRSVNRIAEND